MPPATRHARAAALPLLATLALLAAAPSRAQDAAPSPGEDPRAPRFADVERGLFIGFEFGWPVVLLDTPPAKDPVAFPSATEGGGNATGQLVGLQLGYDVTPRVAVSLFAEGIFQKASLDYGAFDLMVAGLDARWAFWGSRDRNGWERFFTYVHGRGGVTLSHPKGLFGDQDVLLGGGLGLEYFAQLRHFSWWVQVDGLYVLDAGTAGAALMTGARYTF